jgi:hypothetical protein
MTQVKSSKYATKPDASTIQFTQSDQSHVEPLVRIRGRKDREALPTSGPHINTRDKACESKKAWDRHGDRDDDTKDMRHNTQHPNPAH